MTEESAREVIGAAKEQHKLLIDEKLPDDCEVDNMIEASLTFKKAARMLRDRGVDERMVLSGLAKAHDELAIDSEYDDLPKFAMLFDAAIDDD
jgi:hypothetical protein